MYGAGLRVLEATGLEEPNVAIDARIVRVLGKGARSASCRSGDRPSRRRYLALGAPTSTAGTAPTCS